MCTGSFFFFPRRRRRTRCLSDWSSDVCSSDLSIAGASSANGANVDSPYTDDDDPNTTRRTPARRAASIERSEERRVGKECRRGTAPSQKAQKAQTEEDHTAQLCLRQWHLSTCR